MIKGLTELLKLGAAFYLLMKAADLLVEYMYEFYEYPNKDRLGLSIIIGATVLSGSYLLANIRIEIWEVICERYKIKEHVLDYYKQLKTWLTVG